jgi:hypothetical protein
VIAPLVDATTPLAIRGSVSAQHAISRYPAAIARRQSRASPRALVLDGFHAHPAIASLALCDRALLPSWQPSIARV